MRTGDPPLLGTHVADYWGLDVSIEICLVRCPILQLSSAGILGFWSVVEGIALYGLPQKMVS